MKTKTQNLTIMAVFAAISVVALLFIRIPIIPAAPFLTYDMADIPILLITLLISPIAGLVDLLIVCFIQAFFLGGDGIIGFIMHFFASAAMVLIMGYIYKKWNKVAPHLIIAAVLSTIARTLIMIPMNLIFTVIFLGTPRQVVVDMLIPAIIPFNLIIAGLNCALAIVLFIALKPVYKKITIN